LVIALNDAAYNNIVSLVVNGVSVPKSAFKWGTPKPCKLWTWPSGDVYPTWFNDTKINVGLIPTKNHKDLVVSISFSDPNGVRIHFDAYGKTTSKTPTYARASTQYIIGYLGCPRNTDKRSVASIANNILSRLCFCKESSITKV
jgi:hypothetical protein